MSPLRIGFTQRVEDLPDRGERRDALDQAWTRVAASLGAAIVPIPNGLADPVGWIRHVGIAALVLTGGNDLAHLPGARGAAPERDALERGLLGAEACLGMPMFGVCRGLQAMVHFHGGRLERVSGHAGTTHAVRSSGRFPAPAGGRVASYHDWGIPADGLPVEFEGCAFAPDGTIEAARHRGLPRAGILWHPERGAPDPVLADWLRAFLAGDPG